MLLDKKVKREAAAQRRPAQSERKKPRFFHETTGVWFGMAKHFKLKISKEGSRISLKSALGKGWGAWGEGKHLSREQRGFPSPNKLCMVLTALIEEKRTWLLSGW